MSAPPSLRLAAALTRLSAAQDAQQAEALRLRLALAETRAAIDGLGRSAEAHLGRLGILQADVARLGAACRRLEVIMSRAGGEAGR